MTWKTIYSDRNIKRWGLPASGSLNNQGYARGLVLTWTEMQKNFRKLDPPPDSSDNIWYVVCDVLILDDNPIIDDELYLFARRIEIQSDLAFLISNTATSVTIVTQEIVRHNKPASLQASFMPFNDVDDPQNVKLTPLTNKPATIFTLTNPANLETAEWEPSPSIVSSFEDNLSSGETLRLGIVTTFQAASLLALSTDSDILEALRALKMTQSELVIKQLEWVAAISDVGDDTRLMAGQARTQLGWIIKKNQGLVVVPPLDFSVYRDAADAWLKVLKDRSVDYDKWIDLERNNENWLAQAKLVVGLQINESALQTKIEEHANAKLKMAQKAESEAAFQLQALKTALIAANLDFEAGVEIWKRKNETKAIFKLIADSLTFVIEVGKLVAQVASIITVPGVGELGAGEADVNNLGGAAKIATDTPPSTKVTSQFEQVKGQFEQVKNLAGPLSGTVKAALNIAGDINKIVEIAKVADAADKMAENTLEKVNSSLNKTFTVSPLQGLNTVTGGKQVWESLKVTMDDIFSIKKNLLNNIKGGAQYRVAFRQLIVGAEAYCSARLAVAEAKTSLAEAKLRRDAVTKSVKLAENTEQKFESDDAIYEQLQQNAFGRVLDAKRAVYFQLEQYQQASYYFTLSNTERTLPSITASVADFMEESATIAGFELILDELNPTPQHLRSLSIFLPVDRERRKDDAIILQIDVTNEQFEQYARIRIDKIEPTLLDDNGQPIIVNWMKMGTSGIYYDTVPLGGIAKFSGNPFIRTITYDDRGEIILDSDVYARFEDVVFKPTPFTTWTFKLPNVETAKKVARLKLTITGAASPTVNENTFLCDENANKAS